MNSSDKVAGIDLFSMIWGDMSGSDFYQYI